MATLIQFRRGTATEWSTADTILADGEPGYERGTGKLKIGDGVSAWDDLPYFGEAADALEAAIQAEATARADADAALIPLTQKGANNGVATLGATGLIPDAQISAAIARSADLTTAVANLVDSSPGALNTLNELAAALGDDPNFATTIVNSIAAVRSGAMGVVVHGADANVARPAGYGAIHWIGSVAPVNVSDNDLWTDPNA